MKGWYCFEEIGFAKCFIHLCPVCGYSINSVDPCRIDAHTDDEDIGLCDGSGNFIDYDISPRPRNLPFKGIK